MTNTGTSNRPFRVGVIGAGYVVEDCHLPVLSMRHDVSLAWVTDADVSKANRLSRMYNTVAIAAADVPTALTGVDVCLIAIPIGARQTYFDLCASLGVAAYVEKPFARTAAEHDALCIRFAPHRLAVGYQRRFYRAATIARSVVAAAPFGPLRAVTAAIGSYALKGGGGRYITDRALAGGGVVIELGVHLLDQVVHITEARDVEVTALSAVMEDGLDHHVFSSGRLRLRDGSIPVAATISRLQALDVGIVLKFDRAAVRIGIDASSDVFVTYPGVPDVMTLDIHVNRTRQPTARTTGQAFADIWAAFLDGLTTGAVSAASAVTSGVTSRWVDKIYQGLSRA